MLNNSNRERVNAQPNPVDELSKGEIDAVKNEESTQTEKSLIAQMGVVANCESLNVRRKPSISSEIVLVLSRGMKITVDKLESTEDFHKVYTLEGIDGFCMKKFIELET